MKETDIRKYATLMQELGLTGLEITEDNKAVRLERMSPASEKQVTTVEIPTQAPPAAQISSTESADYISITSPIVGIFYAASAENADPYVSVGDRIEKGKTLCIIEAMKLMNEICANDSGVISEICVTNGQVVEYGTELFRIRR